MLLLREKSIVRCLLVEWFDQIWWPSFKHRATSRPWLCA